MLNRVELTNYSKKELKTLKKEIEYLKDTLEKIMDYRIRAIANYEGIAILSGDRYELENQYAREDAIKSYYDDIDNFLKIYLCDIMIESNKN